MLAFEIKNCFAFNFTVAIHDISPLFTEFCYELDMLQDFAFYFLFLFRTLHTFLSIYRRRDEEVIRGINPSF